MDALLDDEEALLKETLDSMLHKAVPATVRELLELDDRGLWRTLADAGVLGLGLDPGAGGAGSLSDMVIAVEALGRVLAPAPMVGVTVLAGQLLTAAGASPDLVASLVRGDVRLAVALDAGVQDVADASDAAAVAFDAAGADAALALDQDRIVAFPLREPSDGLDRTRRLRPLRTGTPVDIGDLGQRLTADALARWRAIAWTALAADTVGVMDGALRLAIAHATTREQFGVPIGSFQAIQHLLAESFASLLGARSLVRFAGWAIDHRPPEEGIRAAHTAKAYCAQVGQAVGEAVIQVHGGMGMTWDCPAHLHLRRAIADGHVLGDERTHLRALVGI